MDKGLTAAVAEFTGSVGKALIDAAGGTGVRPSDLNRDANLEAFSLVCAVIDSDGRQTDDELWALPIAFGEHDLLHWNTTPKDLRNSAILSGAAGWMTRVPDMFLTLTKADRVLGTQGARVYYNQAMRLAHMVASLDQVPSSAELEAIVGFQRLLLAALDSNKGQVSQSSIDQDDSPGTVETLPDIVDLGPPEAIEDLLAELDQLIGLDEVKAEVRLIAALLRVQKMRADRGLPVVDNTMHLVFSGNPGTGKTTVARLLARIYRSLGAVEVGHLTEVDRSGLVAGYVGQTAKIVNKVFESADGGVLLVDEAYSLIRGGEKDFGREAIDAIVKQVEDRRDTMVVILAGYPKEMAELIAANPGFGSRFPKTIDFPDYSNTELVEILQLITQSHTYSMDSACTEAARAWFGSHERGHGFGNGRLARNLFEAAVAQHAKRLMSIENPTDEELITLVATDIASVPVVGED